MTQQKARPQPGDVFEKFEKFEKSKKPGIEFGVTISSEDAFRPSTADMNVKRKSFDTKATDHHKETVSPSIFALFCFPPLVKF